MARSSTLPKRLQPMLATLTDAPFDDPGFRSFEDKYDGFPAWSLASKPGGATLYRGNGKIISHSYVEVAQALEGVKEDAALGRGAGGTRQPRRVAFSTCFRMRSGMRPTTVLESSI